MRIGFITLSCAYNYGAVLQTYALYKFLVKNGYDVILIDYITERYQIDDPEYVYKNTVRWKKNKMTRFLWKKIKLKAEIARRDCFRFFLDSYVPKTEVYLSYEQLKKDLPQCDIYISGSDQIWNTDFSRDKKPDLPYFLGFVPRGIPKIAYSSSFGKQKLNACEKEDVRQLLASYNKIAVREQSGKEIINELGLESVVVADPTLLCDVEEWNKLAMQRQYTEKYLLLFQIFPNKKLIKVARKIAKTKSCKLVILSADPMQKYGLMSEAIILPRVEQWLSFFKYADYIITDSFHGTVYSILFNRQFLSSTMAINPTRIHNILSILKLDSRAFSDVSYNDLIKKLNTNIDYNVVNIKLHEFVRTSKEWLLNSILSVEGKRNE